MFLCMCSWRYVAGMIVAQIDYLLMGDQWFELPSVQYTNYNLCQINDFTGRKLL